MRMANSVGPNSSPRRSIEVIGEILADNIVERTELTTLGEISKDTSDSRIEAVAGRIHAAKLLGKIEERIGKQVEARANRGPLAQLYHRIGGEIDPRAAGVVMDPAMLAEVANETLKEGVYAALSAYDISEHDRAAGTAYNTAAEHADIKDPIMSFLNGLITSMGGYSPEVRETRRAQYAAEYLAVSQADPRLARPQADKVFNRAIAGLENGDDPIGAVKTYQAEFVQRMCSFSLLERVFDRIWEEWAKGIIEKRDGIRSESKDSEIAIPLKKILFEFVSVGVSRYARAAQTDTTLPFYPTGADVARALPNMRNALDGVVARLPMAPEDMTMEQTRAAITPKTTINDALLETVANDAGLVGADRDLLRRFADLWYPTETGGMPEKTLREAAEDLVSALEGMRLFRSVRPAGATYNLTLAAKAFAEVAKKHPASFGDLDTFLASLKEPKYYTLGKIYEGLQSYAEAKFPEPKTPQYENPNRSRC